MRDDQGYFERYKQSLYYARLLADQLEQLEASTPEANALVTQQHNCYFDASVQNLTRALCFLAAVTLAESQARDLLNKPNDLALILADELEKRPSAALSLLQQAITRQDGSAVGLAELLSRYAQVWGQVAVSRVGSVSGTLIQSSAQQRLGSSDCRGWHRQLVQLGDAVVDMTTEY